MDLAPLVPVLLLVAGAVGCFVLAGTPQPPSDGMKPSRSRSGGLAWIGLLASASACLELWNDRRSAFGLVESDPLGRLLSLEVLLGIALVLPVLGILCRRDGVNERRCSRLYGLTLLGAAGMLLAVSTQNLLVLLVGVEMMSAVLYAVSARQPSSIRPVPAYFSSRHIGVSAAFVLALAVFQTTAGSLDLAKVEAASGGAGMRWPATAGLGLLLVGLVSRAVLFLVPPSPRSLCAPRDLLAVVALIPIVGGLLRITGWLFVPAAPVRTLLGILAVAMWIGAGFAARPERGENPRLGWAGLAQLGYLLTGVAVGAEPGRSAVALHLLASLLAGLGAWTALLASELESGGAPRIFAGWIWRSRWTGLPMTVFLLSLAAVPTTAGFVARLRVLEAAMGAGLLGLVAVAMVASLAGVYQGARILVDMYRRGSAAEPEVAESPRALRFLLLLTSAATVLLGALPEPFLTLAERVALEFF